MKILLVPLIILTALISFLIGTQFQNEVGRYQIILKNGLAKLDTKTGQIKFCKPAFYDPEMMNVMDCKIVREFDENTENEK